ERATSEVAAHLDAAAGRLARAGARVSETRLPAPLDDYLEAHRVLIQSEVAAVHAARRAARADRYAPRLRAYIEAGSAIPAADLSRARVLARDLRGPLLAQLRAFDAFLLPTVSDVAPARDTTGDPSFQAIWTLFGLPAISLPSGLSAEGLPFALQLVAAPGADAQLLAAAAACERALGAPIGPPPGTDGGGT